VPQDQGLSYDARAGVRATLTGNWASGDFSTKYHRYCRQPWSDARFLV